MSGPAGTAPPTSVLGLGLEMGGLWRQRGVQESRALVHRYLLSSSVHLPPTAGAGSGGLRTRLRLPSLVTSAKGRRSSARLSLSEPSLLLPNENVLCERFSRHCRSSVSQTRPLPPPDPLTRPLTLLPFNTCHQSGTGQQLQSRRPGYIHFSQALQLSSKSRPARRQSHNQAPTTETCDLRPLAMQHYNSSSPRGEPLSIVGKPCLLSCSERPAVRSARAQLHVFLPTEAEREEVDSESVDEGFMDELDSKITCLSLQRGTTPPPRCHAADRHKHTNLLLLK